VYLLCLEIVEVHHEGMAAVTDPGPGFPPKGGPSTRLPVIFFPSTRKLLRNLEKTPPPSSPSAANERESGELSIRAPTILAPTTSTSLSPRPLP